MNIFTAATSFIKHAGALSYHSVESGTRQDSESGWFMLITISAILLAGIIVWNAWAFDTVASGGAIGTPSPQVTQIFNRSSLDAINAIFTSRANEESKYVNGAYRYSDPSQ